MTAEPIVAVSFRAVLRVREFRVLWLADLQSLLGDQLARVALSVLTFARTGSALATATVYSLTFLPALFGTPLGTLADRLPRRALLVCGDLVRAMLLALIAIPAMPLGAVMALLFLAVLVGTPWKAAEAALIADILAGEGYVLGSGLRLATGQATQLAGFAVGGAVVAAIGTHVALVVDAGTFAVSAVALRLAIAARPPVRSADHGGTGWRTGVGVVMTDPQLRRLLGYAWLVGAFVVPEGLAAPYAARLGGGAQAVGLLLASAPAGMLVSSLPFVRLVKPATRARAVPVLAGATGLPLMACAAQPGLAVTMLLWAISGALMAYQIQVMTAFVAATPVQFRGQAIAFAASGMLAAQGLGLLIAGALSPFWSTSTIIAGAGAVGSTFAVLLARARPRTRHP
jgi:Transmembrane secretion effector